MLQSMGLQRVGHDLVTEQQQISLMSACTPDPPVPSLPVIVNIVRFMGAKELKISETAKHYSFYDKKNCNLGKIAVSYMINQPSSTSS